MAKWTIFKKYNIVIKKYSARNVEFNVKSSSVREYLNLFKWWSPGVRWVTIEIGVRIFTYLEMENFFFKKKPSKNHLARKAETCVKAFSNIVDQVCTDYDPMG